MKVTARPPAKFEHDKYDEEAAAKWELWLSTWKNYACLINIDGNQPTNPLLQNQPVVPLYTEAIKITMLLNIAGEKITKIYSKVAVTATDTLAVAIGKITAEVAPVMQKQHARGLFRRTEWHTYDTVGQYREKLEEASRMCEFGGTLDEEIGSAIIANCNNRDLKLKLMWLTNPTLQQIIATCKTQEVISKTLNESEPKQLVNAIASTRNKTKSEVIPQARYPTSSAKTTACYNCAESFPHPNGGKCKAVGHTCGLCGKLNHFEKCCWSNENNQPA